MRVAHINNIERICLHLTVEIRPEITIFQVRGLAGCPIENLQQRKQDPNEQQGPHPGNLSRVLVHDRYYSMAG
jgi:hypothetical protein